MWKFKSWKGKDKWIFLLTVGVILCILAFPVEKLTGRGKEETANGKESVGEWKTSEEQKIAEGWGAAAGWTADSEEYAAAGAESDSEANPSAGSTGVDALEVLAKAGSSYEAQLEQRIRDLLKHVDGVGNVDVMVVLKSSSEKVIHIDESTSSSSTDENDSSGGSRKVENQEYGSSTVLISQNGQNLPIIEKEICPEVSGIIISATGGGNPGVQAEISAAMEALFGLPAHKIKVLKRAE